MFTNYSTSFLIIKGYKWVDKYRDIFQMSCKDIPPCFFAHLGEKALSFCWRRVVLQFKMHDKHFILTPISYCQRQKLKTSRLVRWIFFVKNVIVQKFIQINGFWWKNVFFLLTKVGNKTVKNWTEFSFVKK